MEYEYKKSFLINVCFIAVWGLLAYGLIRFMIGFLLPFIMAILFAFFSHKAAVYVSGLIKLTEKRLIWVFLITFYLLILLSAGLSVFLLIKYSGNLFSGFKDYLSSPNNIFYKVTERLSLLASRLPENLKSPVLEMLDNFSKKALSSVADTISSLTVSIVKFLPQFFISAAVSVVASFYITKDYSRLVKFLKLMVGKVRFLRFQKIKNIITGSVLKFFSGYLILSSITFLIVFLFFLLLSVNHAFILAFLVALVDLLPVLGAGTALIPAAVFNLLAGKTLFGVLLFVLYIAVTVLRNFLEPKIISDRVNVNPLLMLLTLFIGLRIGGVAGMFILPVATVTMITYYTEEMKKE